LAKYRRNKKKVSVFKSYYGRTTPKLLPVLNPILRDTATVARPYRLHGMMQ